MPLLLGRTTYRAHNRSRDWAVAYYLPEVLVALALVRLGLTFIGLSGVRALGLPALLRQPVAQLDPARLARAVRAGSRLVPFASCLTQAQAAQILLARRGMASTISLGVRETAAGELAAHAWLSAGGRLLMGGNTHELAVFRHLAELGPTR
jgi:hypothetical protein